ncbi:sigma-54 dependent transcriptional regulator [Paracoccus sp. (in: a-proteobacteria)]|uniref:response regulator n=1 Tax=Paracoccus sp. TaxID=267 RepID=UPI0026E0C307|nr:sigma-54 dependent transcriptional regulator [Paracoccus sp. (in: a-proteobacteria)]MDO5647828.1 sigma-54 dependent transcriptional regulator [Paracoccus sp. (in: a-proteobacteria)]
MDGTVLIADDDRTIRMVLTQALTRAGCRVHATGSLAQLTKWVDEGRGDLVITDVMMPDGNGLDAIPAIHRARPDLPVIVISAQNTIVTAIRATEADAFDYLPKPFDLPDLMAKSGLALSRRRRRAAVEAAPERADPGLPLIGHAPAMQALFRTVARVLNADLAVLIAGEPGVGRSTIARSFHDLSDRQGRGMVVLTPACAQDAITRAAASAQGGTILIENPAGFSAPAQAQLIAMIESADAGPDGSHAPRIVATTGPDPAAEVAGGALRADLYYRLAGVTITVPPLRARVDDILPLAAHFLARAAGQGLPSRSLSDDAAGLLRAHPFPGNVRELENLMRRLALTAAGAAVSVTEMRDALGQQVIDAPQSAPPPPAGALLADSVMAHLQRYFDLHGDALPPPGLYDRVLREIERPLVQVALDAVGGNQLKCADLLGINRNTLRKKLTDLNIEVTRRRKLM